jgi:hypothetical protein
MMLSTKRRYRRNPAKVNEKKALLSGRGFPSDSRRLAAFAGAPGTAAGSKDLLYE